MGITKKHAAVAAIGVVVVGIGYYLFNKRKKTKAKQVEQQTAQQSNEVEMEDKVVIEIPTPTQDAEYTTDKIENVFRSAAEYYGGQRFIDFTQSLKTIIDSIDKTARSKKLSERDTEREVSWFMSPIIFMMENKFNIRQHNVKIDMDAFEEEILPKITTKEDGFYTSYNNFKALMLWEKITVLPAEPVNGFMGGQNKQFVH